MTDFTDGPVVKSVMLRKWFKRLFTCRVSLIAQ